MSVSDAQVENLIKSLENIASKMEAATGDAAGGAGGRAADGDVYGDPTDSAKQAERAAKAFRELNKDVEVSGSQMTEYTRILADMQNGVAGAADEMADFQSTLKKGGAKFDKAYDNMFKLTGAADQLNSVLPTSKQEMLTFGTSLMESVKSGDIFISMAKKLIGTMVNLAVQTDAATAGFMGMTGAFSQGNNLTNEYAKVIGGAERQLAHLGATEKDVAQAAGSLYTGYSNFTNLSKDQKKALVAQTAVMDKLNVSTGLTAQIFDTATKSLGFTDDQLIGLTENLHATAQSLGKSTEQVVQDFGVVSKQLAFYGTDVVGVFEDMQKQSKATGLTMGELLSISGEAYDTFDGAAEKVGRLNAILGGPYLNSIDMLNASESERLEMITASMDASGQMFSELGKYEQKAIASALGVEVDVARRMFGELSAAEEMEIRQQEKMAETAAKAQKVIDKLTNAFYSLVVRIDWLVGIMVKPIDWFSSFAGWLNDGSSAMKTFAKWLLNIGVLFGGLWGMLKTGGKALTKAGNAAGSLGRGMRTVGKVATNVFGKGSPVGSAVNTVSSVSTNMRMAGLRAQKMGRFMTKAANSIAKPFRIMGNAIRHPIQAFKRLTDLAKGLPKLLSKIKMPSIKMPAWLSNLSKLKMPSFKIPNLSGVSKGLRKVALNFGKIKDTVSKFKMPDFGKLSRSLQGMAKSSKVLQFFGKVLHGLAKPFVILELAYHTIMSIKDNFSLFGDALREGEGFFEKYLGWMASIFIIIGDAAARATDSLVNFGVWIANIFLPENWELPELNLSGMIQDSLANLDFGFINDQFAYMGQMMIDGILSIVPGWAKKWLGIGADAKTEKAEIDSVQGAENRRAEREGREPKKITAEDVDDVVITASGKVIKPNSKDTIIAAKPGGPLLKSQEEQQDGLGQMASLAAKAMNPLGSLFSGVTGAVQDQIFGKKGAPEGKGTGDGTPNVKVDVSVKIGEKQLTDIIIEALSSPEAGKAISPFLN